MQIRQKLFSNLDCFVSEPTNQQLSVLSSSSFNYRGFNIPEKTYDGSLSTWYCPEDGQAAGNYLNLVLDQPYSIGIVILISRENVDGLDFVSRMSGLNFI